MVSESGLRVWVVGGAIRDAALGRPVTDLDLAVAGDPKRLAGAVARATGGHPFRISSQFGTWRVVSPTAAAVAWQVDLTLLRGPDIEADLAERDFTIGAVALEISERVAGTVSADGTPILLDPFDGIRDLERGQLRVVSERSFSSDPLRLLRAARLAAALELEIEPATAGLARAEAPRAGEPAGERQLEELRLLVGGSRPRRGMETLLELGVLGRVLPEMERLRGVEQGPNHHLDVYDHTLAVLDGVLAIEADAGALLDPVGEGQPQVELAAVESLLAQPLADGFNRREALRFGALFHDLGKPDTKAERDGFTGFPGHDRVGAELIDGIAKRLKMSRKLRRHLGDLALHHLRLGFLIPERPLDRRQIFSYLQETAPVSADVTLLTVADRLAARGRGGLASEEMVRSHLSLARELLAAALELERDGSPPPLLRGDEICDSLRIKPGPELAGLVDELAAAQYAGEISTREDAVTHLRQLTER